MLNKTEEKLFEKVIEGSIELKIALYKKLGGELNEIQSQLAQLLGTPASTIEHKTINTETKETKTETKSNIKNKAKKIEDRKEMVKCGPSEGADDIVFIRKSGEHMYYGQMRINGVIKNFNYSNQLFYPILYGATNMSEIDKLRESVINLLTEEENSKYTRFNRVVATSQGCDARYIHDFDNNGFIYLTPEFNKEGKDEDIIAKGYYMEHAFIVRRDEHVRFKHYNYVFRKCGFEATPSKGTDKNAMLEGIGNLLNNVIEQYDSYCQSNPVSNNKTTYNTAGGFEDVELPSQETMNILFG